MRFVWYPADVSKKTKYFKLEVVTIQDNESKLKREDLIDVLVDNLSALRAKIGITQTDLASSVGIGRQTLLSIENKKSKMRWDTFLTLVVVFSKNDATSNYMRFLGIHLEEVEVMLQNEIRERKGGYHMSLENLWTDNNYKGDTTLRGIVPLPIGLRNSKCPKCHSKNIRGAIIMPTADEQDPNIVCLDCGYWWD